MFVKIKQYYLPHNIHLWILFVGIFMVSCANSETNSHLPDAEIETEKKTEEIIKIQNIDPIRDKQGNEYSVINFKQQLWATSNYLQTEFNNGDKIKEAKNAKEWSNATQKKEPICCYYNYDIANKELYGVYYNWYAVNDERGLAPDGWVVAPNQQVNILTREFIYAHPLKQEKHWKQKGLTYNSTGFSARPGGLVHIDGSFGGESSIAYFWTATEKNDSNAMCVDITDEFNGIHFSDLNKQFGMPIRIYKPLNNN